MNNLFADVATHLSSELVDVLTESKHVRIERIVSAGQTSPSDFWYDQDEAEWVAVLKGEAKLLFEGDETPIELGPGDHLVIPAHHKHRVQWTAPDEPTVWLAVFYKQDVDSDNIGEPAPLKADQKHDR